MSAWSNAVAALSPYAWYRLSDASGTVLADSSGNARTGSMNGTGGINFQVASLVPGGADNTAMQHTGNSVGMFTPTISVSNIAVTHVVTIKSSASTARGTLFESDGATHRLILTGTNAQGQVSSGAAVTFSPAYPSANLFDNVAHLVVYVVRATSAELWVDGVMVGSGSHSAGSETITKSKLKNFFSDPIGTYDEWAIFNSALSSGQIGDLYAGWLGGPPTGTLTLAGTVAGPTGAFELDNPSENRDIELAGTVVGPTAAFTLTMNPMVTLAGTVAAPTGAFSLTANPTLALAATVPAPTGAFALQTFPTLRLAGTVDSPIATFVAYAVAPVTPSPVVGAQSVVVAQAFGAVTMQGTQPVYTISSAYIPRARQRILVDNVDVTYFRGGITPPVKYTLLEPLLYGPATLDLPQVSACFERPGVGALSFLRPGATVEVQRVLDDEVVATDYKGVVVAFDISGRNLSVEIGGEANGRAALRNWQVPIFPRINDLGHQFAVTIRNLGLSFYPPLGPTTGIDAMTTGGTGHLEHIQALVAKAWTRAGKHWTIMPDETTGAYEAHRKDEETIHGTVFIDDARTVANLRRDIAEEPNRIYVTGVTPSGQRIRFGVYPGLIQGPVPAFMGHLDEGDTGEAVRLLIGKLHATGYLKLVETAGGYDADVVEAVKRLQNDADLFQTGEVNEATWQALYDLGVTNNSVEWAHIEPAAQRRKVRPWNRSAQGGIMGINDGYEPDELVRDHNVDLETGFDRSQMLEFAWTKLYDSNDPNWVGDITFHTGALIRGDGFEGMTVDAGDVMDARELRPGMNLDLPQFDGGTFVHIAAIQVDDSGIVTATVDTRFRDAMEVWEIIARNKESRGDPARTRDQKRRSSTIVKDSIGEWDEIGGLLGQDIHLEAGWNVFPVVAAMEGTIARLKIHTSPATEFVVAVFGEVIGRGTLHDLIGNPLTEAGSAKWSQTDTRDTLRRDHELLYVAGNHEQPCGYWPKHKGQKGDHLVGEAELTGKWDDDAGFRYKSRVRHMVWVAVYCNNTSATIEAGRIMWPQLEAGV